MKTVIKRKNIIKCIYIIPLILWSTRISDNYKLTTVFDMLAYLLVFGIIFSHLSIKRINKKMFGLLGMTILLNIGLSMQNIGIWEKTRLMLTMFAIATVVYMGYFIFDDLNILRASAYMILFVSFVVILISWAFGIGMTGRSIDVLSNYDRFAFSGGDYIEEFLWREYVMRIY